MSQIFTFYTTLSELRNVDRFSILFRHFSRVVWEVALGDLLGPREHYRCHEVEEMIANDGASALAVP